jgi:hypothetical protein
MVVTAANRGRLFIKTNLSLSISTLVSSENIKKY